MKKAKFMLLAIAVFATVGAALAFKVKKMGSSSYCWLETMTQPPPGDCVNGINNATPQAFTGGRKIYYTLTTDHLKCPEAETLDCPNTAQLNFLQ